MSLNFLLLLSDRALPFRTATAAEVDHIEILAAAKLVRASFETATKGLSGGDATVDSLTALGMQLVGCLRRP